MTKTICDLCNKEIVEEKDLYKLDTKDDLQIVLDYLNDGLGEEEYQVHKKCVVLLKKDKKFILNSAEKIVGSWEIYYKDGKEKYILSNKKREKIRKKVMNKVKKKVKNILK